MAEKIFPADAVTQARADLINAPGHNFSEAHPDKDETWPQSGFSVRAVDKHHVRITTHGNYAEPVPKDADVLLNAYAEVLRASGNWRDVKVTNRALRSNEVRATLADAPVIQHLDTRETYRAFAKEHGISYPHGLDGVSARLVGQYLGNEGVTWDAQQGEADALYLFLVYTLDGIDTAYVSLAQLGTWAAED